MNCHHCSYWADQDPHVISEMFLNLPKIMIWCRITSDMIVDPFMFYSAIDAEGFIMSYDKICPVVNTWTKTEDLMSKL